MPDRKTTRERRYELDWLRVYAIFLLIAVHAAAIFDPFPVTAVKGKPNLVMKLFAIFLHEWRLSVLFLVSGAGAYFALKSLGSARFIRMRFRRIVIPLIVGTLVVVPVHLYLWVRGLYPGRYSSYFDFYRQLLSDAFLHGRIGNKPEYIHWAHLWFLAYLFVISVVTIPLFIYLRKRFDDTESSKLVWLLDRRGGLFLAALPLIASQLLLRTRWPGFDSPLLINDWANFSMYLIQYVYGYLIYSDEGLRVLVKRVSTRSLLLAITTTLIFFGLAFTRTAPRSGYNVGWMLFLVFRSFNAWFWIIAVVGFGMKYLNYTNRVLPYANEAAYPIYIIHLPILSFVSYYIVQWNAPATVQFLAIIFATLLSAIVIYTIFIRQTKVTRFLFGMKLTPPAKTVRRAEASYT